MPGPRSTATSSTPTVSESRLARMSTPPSMACRARLVPISVATIARSPSATGDSPAASPRPTATRRTPLAAEMSWTGIQRPSWSRVVTSALPLDGGHDRALADLGPQVQFVHQPARAGQAKAEPAGGREAVGEGPVHVRDAEAFVGEDEADPLSGTVGHRLDVDPATAAVDQRVAGELARRRDDLGLVDQAESGRDGGRADQLAHPDHVVVHGYRQRLRGPDRLRVDHCAPTDASSAIRSAPSSLAISPAAAARSSRSRARPRSTSSAVRMPLSARPSSTSVIATAGRMPTTTVSASNTRDTVAIVAIIRP